MLALAICLGVVSVSALTGMGWFAWLMTTKMDSMARDFARALTLMKTSSDTLAQNLVLGYQASAPPSEPPTTASPESESSQRDEFSWDDMPEHIREHYLREQMEERLMTTPSSTPS